MKSKILSAIIIGAFFLVNTIVFCVIPILYPESTFARFANLFIDRVFNPIGAWFNFINF